VHYKHNTLHSERTANAVFFFTFVSKSKYLIYKIILGFKYNENNILHIKINSASSKTFILQNILFQIVVILLDNTANRHFNL